VAKTNFLPLYRDVAKAMLASRLNGSEYRALMLIIVEHLKHAGKENGSLIVTQKDFINTGGIDHASVAGAIRGLVAKGFIAVKGGEYNAGTGRRNHLVFTLNILERKSRDRSISVLCQTENPHKVQTENPHHTQTENPHHTVQTENPHNYLDLGLPYPPDAVGQASPPHGPARRRRLTAVR
jgi:DNA-binding MarR family transcriptional regulator